MSAPRVLNLAAAAAAGAALLLAACEDPRDHAYVQTGPDGTGMVQIETDRLSEYLEAQQAVPPPPYELEATDGPRAGEVYQNVPALGSLSADEFNRLMIAITEWVVPEAYRNDPNSGGGCNYCHNPENLASDEVYTKVVTRRMFQMTWTINADWTSHVKETGVTCWTCHRGKPVPEYAWATSPGDTAARGLQGRRFGQNDPVASVAYSTLPNDPFTPYLLGDKDIRVGSTESLSTGGGASIQATEQVYGFMMHMSDALGVNCTYCHNTQNFGSWQISNAARTPAWHGIRMARAINNDYINPLGALFAAHPQGPVKPMGDPPSDRAVYDVSRIGPMGDPMKVNCSTCHQGLAKPMGGAQMLAAWPELRSAAAPWATAAPAIEMPAPMEDTMPSDAPAEAAPETPPAQE